MKKYTKDHEWILVKEDIGIVGITDFAQKQLGDIVSIDLPKIGKEYKKGETIAIVDSMKASSDVYSPVSGTVVEINELLSSKPELLNISPENEGWIVKLKNIKKEELSTLMDEEKYNEYCKSQTH